MSIWTDENSKVVVQGLTGKEGSFHARKCREYGTQIVAGVTPGKEGVLQDGVPVFNTVKKAVEEQAANCSMILVPPPFAADAIMEAVEVEIPLVVCITEGIPVFDMLRVTQFMKGMESRLIGPNCPGIISPGKSKIGIMPGPIHKEGRVGCISRSGTLTYEAVGQLSSRGIGQSTCIGIGGDPIIGTGFIDALKAFNDDSETDVVVMIGEIGGSAEEEAAEYIRDCFKKPVVGFVAGQTAPPGRRMGHAGAIISQGQGTASGKIEKMRECGILVVDSPAEIGLGVEEVLQKGAGRSS